MIIIRILLIFLLSFTLRGYVPQEEKDVIWLYVENDKTKKNYYLEVSFDGKVLLRYKEGNRYIVKEGLIKKSYVKDFFRETKNSDLLNYAKSVDVSKMLFFEQDLIKISANIAGEIRRVIAPIGSFSKTFVYAFNQVYEEAQKLNETKNYVSFIYSAPLQGELYDNYLKVVPQGYILPVVETSELKKNKYIFKAISYPWRLIGITSKKDESAIMDFVSYKRLYGIKSAFYIGTSRGNFQISIID